MKYLSVKTSVLFLVIILASCTPKKNNVDASGSFEAEETIISSEASGVIKQFNIDEGVTLKQGQEVGYIDSIQLYLRKKQLVAQINALLGKKPNVQVQLASLKQQLQTAEKEQGRITNLLKSNVAPSKQLDDINAQIEILKKQIEAQKSTLEISTEGLNKDATPLQIQIEQLNDQLAKFKITNPINGTVLSKYTEVNEVTSPGKPLYKIADLSTIILRAYITDNQLPLVKLNQKVKVLTTDQKGGYKETEGIIAWINDKAEFTPKTIQTKDERANLVYAVKVKVKNDGSFKIGMYGEIKF